MAFHFSLLRHFFLTCVIFIFFAGIPLVPRLIDRIFPIPIDGLSWHELLESFCMQLLTISIFSIFYRIVTNDQKYSPNAFVFIPILFALTMSIEGNGIHWSTNAIHSTFNPGQEYQYNNTSLLFKLTYFLDENLGHHMLIGGLLLSFLIIIWYQRLYTFDTHYFKKVDCIDKFAFYILSFGMGIVVFAAGIEGQTVKTLNLPWAVIIVIDYLFLNFKQKQFYSISTFLILVAFVCLFLSLSSFCGQICV